MDAPPSYDVAVNQLSAPGTNRGVVNSGMTYSDGKLPGQTPPAPLAGQNLQSPPPMYSQQPTSQPPQPTPTCHTPYQPTRTYPPTSADLRPFTVYNMSSTTTTVQEVPAHGIRRFNMLDLGQGNRVCRTTNRLPTSRCCGQDVTRRQMRVRGSVMVFAIIIVVIIATRIRIND